MVTKLGILNPGQMGISVAASAVNSSCEVYWASEGRSPETRERAESQPIIDLGSVEKLCQNCTILISVVPPHAAETQAAQVVETGFKGLYVDANAISPEKVKRINQLMMDEGMDFVDGSIVGGPAWEAGSTWLYLSGPQAQRAAVCFSSGPLGTEVIGDEIGKASALKMCYAAYTKGTSALLCAILAAAEGLEVRKELENQWARDWTDFVGKTQERVRRVTAKAWRFAGEMDEIAETFAGVGVPDGFHRASGDIYRRIGQFKGRHEHPELVEVLDALLGNNETHEN